MDYRKTGVVIFSASDLKSRIDADAGITPNCIFSAYNADTSVAFVSFDAALSAAEETTLDNIIAVANVESLPHIKTRLKALCGDFFDSKIAEGCTHDGAVFSESNRAEAQWVYTKGNSNEFVYPYNLPTLDGGVYSVADAVAMLVVVDAVIADIKAKTEAFRDACNDITNATTNAIAQTAYNNYVGA